MTANGEITCGHGVGTTMLAVSRLNPQRADVLLVGSQLWGFDMLLGMVIIKILNRVCINQSAEEQIHFPALQSPDRSTGRWICSVPSRISAPSLMNRPDSKQYCGNGHEIIHLMNFQTGCLNIRCPLKFGKTIDASCGRGSITDGCFPIFMRDWARGVMVIVAGYGHGDTSSNPGPD